MRELIGAVLLIGGTAFCGAAAARRLAIRARVLAALTSAVGVMQAEISFGYTALPVIFAKLADAYPNLSGLFRPCAAALTGDSRLEDRLNAGLSTLPLKPDEREVLRELGSVGRYDAESSAALMERIKLRVSDFAERAREEQREKSRLYGFMGAAAGIAITILII
ncbi:hypothetical protein FACS1894217_05980 [Clostridia bacterium]|nr:hypothetical protein FACS1894217_05980 [Clostridia bacterium]